MTGFSPEMSMAAGDRQYELLVEGLENGEEQVKVTVPERKMSDAEVQKELPGIHGVPEGGDIRGKFVSFEGTE